MTKKYVAIATNPNVFWATYRRTRNTKDEAEKYVVEEAFKYSGVKDGWVVEIEEVEDTDKKME